MTRISVLLVDDQPAFGNHFQSVFGNAVIWARNANDAARRLRAGYRPDIAFVDFHLGDDAPTGLTVMRALVEHSPATRRVCYTTLGENGRILYAVAARHWFDAHAVLDKALADDEVLRAAAAGVNPTQPVWEENLAQAWRIDDLFRKPSWPTLWRVWPQANGSRRAARVLAATPQITDTVIREFAEDASVGMESFRAVFGQTTIKTERGNVARGAPLAAFSAANSAFFQAPDLKAALDWAARRTQ